MKYWSCVVLEMMCKERDDRATRECKSARVIERYARGGQNEVVIRGWRVMDEVRVRTGKWK
jgi:hypothetical protein